MRGELAPPRGGAPPVAVPVRRLLLTAAAGLVAAAAFWWPLLLGGALHGHDWSSHHYHYFDWVRVSLGEHATLPLYMADAWVTPNFLGNAEAPTLGPLAWLLIVLPTDAYLKLLIVAFCAAGLAGCWWLLRDLGASPPVAALLAVVFSWSGFFASHVAVGHHWALGGWLLPLLLALFRRAALGSDAALAGACLVNAATLLGGQHQPFVWQNLLLSGFAALWALRVRSAFPLARWALVLAGTAGVAAVKLLPLWLEFADYAPQARTPGFPAAALLASFARGGQGPDLTHPGVRYEHGAGWWEYAFYVGPLALAALALGAAAARRVWPLGVVGLFFLALSLEPLGLWPWLQDLPVWRSQRSPSRFVFPALFAAAVIAAPGLERLLCDARRRWGRGAALFAWVLVALVAADLWLESRTWQRAATGPAIATRDHRPRPLVVEAPGARAELVEFAPNRLRYRVDASRPTRVVLPLRFGKRGCEWQTGDWRPFDRAGRCATGRRASSPVRWPAR
jgi:hypothetical protein